MFIMLYPNQFLSSPGWTYVESENIDEGIENNDQCAQRLSTFEFPKQIDDLTALDSTLSSVLLVSEGNLWHCTQREDGSSCQLAYEGGLCKSLPVFCCDIKK